MLAGLSLQTIALLLLAGVALDWLLGEARRWHPLVGFGRLAGMLERWCNRRRHVHGVGAWAFAVLPPVAIAYWISATPLPVFNTMQNEWLGVAIHAGLLYFCIGLRSLRDHALPIQQALEQGDLAQAREQALANGITDLTLVLPKEGAEMWVDLMAIPVDAPHPDNAHAFINYLLQPAVIARISNTVSYPNAVPASLPLIDDAVKQDPVLFPSKDAQANLYTMPVLTDAVAGISERIWVNVRKGKTGQD